MKHAYQPNDISCGPTSLKMVGDALGVTQGLSIEEIAQACGTNDQVGTTDTMMAAGMDALGIPYRIGQSRDTEALASFLTDGHGYIVLRTLTRGIKHWVVLYAFEDGMFKVADPWLGRIEYTPEEVMSIWKPRDFFYFEIPTRPLRESGAARRLIKKLIRNDQIALNTRGGVSLLARVAPVPPAERRPNDLDERLEVDDGQRTVKIHLSHFFDLTNFVRRERDGHTIGDHEVPGPEMARLYRFIRERTGIWPGDPMSWRKYLNRPIDRVPT